MKIYPNGADTIVFINNKKNLDIVSIEFNNSNNLTPVFSWCSSNIISMSEGTKIVSGNITFHHRQNKTHQEINDNDDIKIFVDQTKKYDGKFVRDFNNGKNYYINNCHITGISQHISIDASPLYITYSFFAKSLTLKENKPEVIEKIKQDTKAVIKKAKDSSQKSPFNSLFVGRDETKSIPESNNNPGSITVHPSLIKNKDVNGIKKYISKYNAAGINDPGNGHVYLYFNKMEDGVNALSKKTNMYIKSHPESKVEDWISYYTDKSSQAKNLYTKIFKEFSIDINDKVSDIDLNNFIRAISKSEGILIPKDNNIKLNNSTLNIKSNLTKKN